MKKFFLCAAIAFLAFAVNAANIPQYIVTICGTVHQIPDDATIDEACKWIDYWYSVDC